jgi:hypothetical protein
MGRHKEIKRLIERASEACSDSELREVRARLAEALSALRRAESKRRSKSTPASNQWVFDRESGSLRSLTRNQARDAIGKIEQMIGDEKRRMSDGKSDGLITG